MPQDEPDPLPGKGEISWGNLREIVEDLRSVEEDVDLPVPPSQKLEEIIGLRLKLERFAPHLPREAVRLFLAAPSIADTARQLVDAWVVFWQAMERTVA